MKNKKLSSFPWEAFWCHVGVSCSEANKDEVNTQLWASLVAQVVKQCGRPGFDSWVGKIPWRRKWQPTPVFLPGKFHGWRSLVGYSPWGRKELDTTEWLHFHILSLIGISSVQLLSHV